MYCQFYGLREKPFNVTADPSFFFFSKGHKEAFSHLIYGINERKGVIVITGEIGTGKTSICRVLLNQISENIKTSFIINPHFSELQLLKAIIEDFGIDTASKTRLSFIFDLNRFLLKAAEQGENAVLIIDEAQNLRPGELEQVRLLSNLETEKAKLLQIVLVGQPELSQRLELYNLRQLRQRVMVRYHILPLERLEIGEYINHRLDVSGSDGRIKFSDSAFDEIYNFSKGTPRLINFICDRALLAGFVMGKTDIDLDIINHCIDELKETTVTNKI